MIGSGDSLRTELTQVLDDAAAGEPVPASGAGVASAVLVGVLDRGAGPRLLLTERRLDLHHHPGEISFPGGRQDPGESLLQTALREASEEIGLDGPDAEILGMLRPVDTFVSGYTIYPFVASVTPPSGGWRISVTEVERVLEPPLTAIAAGNEKRRLAHGQATIVTDAYVVDGDVIWGATARIIADLLSRLKRFQ